MLLIRLGNAVFIVITHLQIERHARYRSRYLDPLCAKEKLIILKSFHDESADTFALVIRQYENSKQTALIFFTPVRTDSSATDDFISIFYNIEMSPSGSLTNMLRRLKRYHFAQHILGVIFLI